MFIDRYFLIAFGVCIDVRCVCWSGWKSDVGGLGDRSFGDGVRLLVINVGVFASLVFWKVSFSSYITFCCVLLFTIESLIIGLLVSITICSEVLYASLFFAPLEVTTIAFGSEVIFIWCGLGSLLFKILVIWVNASAVSSVLEFHILGLAFKYRTSLSAVCCNVDSMVLFGIGTICGITCTVSDIHSLWVAGI